MYHTDIWVCVNRFRLKNHKIIMRFDEYNLLNEVCYALCILYTCSLLSMQHRKNEREEKNVRNSIFFKVTFQQKNLAK